jgi:hypothetical protein
MLATCEDLARREIRGRARGLPGFARELRSRSNPGYERALAEVKKGRLALVDTVTQHR